MQDELAVARQAQPGGNANVNLNVRGGRRPRAPATVVNQQQADLQAANARLQGWEDDYGMVI